MTSTTKLAVGFGMILSFLSVGVYAQSAGPTSKFAADGISFDYPAGYSVKDESTKETQQFVITRKGSSVRLTIVVTRNWVLKEKLPAAIENFTEPTVKQVATTLGQGNPERTSFQTQVGSKQADGIRLRSTGNKPRTGEVIWLRLKLHLVGFVLVRSDVDESVASQLWQTVSSSFRVESLVVSATTTAVEPTGKPITDRTVLNGKALALPQPAYPALARAAHVSGTVTVQVLINEEGNVTKAHAVDGHPLLQSVCVAAALQAKFSPTTLEGEPVKVTGVIQYHFVAR